MDVTSFPALDEAAATDFFSTVASNLGRAATAAGVPRSVVLSIVGLDESQDYGYYGAKLAHEQATRTAAPGALVLRATQFHDFARQMLEWNTRRRRHPDHGRADPAGRHRRDRPGAPRPGHGRDRPRRRPGRAEARAAGRPRATGTPLTSAPTWRWSPARRQRAWQAARSCRRATTSSSGASTGRPGWSARADDRLRTGVGSPSRRSTRWCCGWRAGAAAGVTPPIERRLPTRRAGGRAGSSRALA